MPNEPFDGAFSGEKARAYDDQWSRLDAFRNVQHLMLDIAFHALPADARILCVGAGTGQEIVFLAKAHPGWTFVAVDPAADMLAICREKMESIGATGRCGYHADNLQTLPESDPFDAATCLLVSHFILNQNERDALFAGIALRLRSGGSLVTADLSDAGADTPLSDFWLETLRYAGMTEDQLAGYRDSMARGVALLPPAEITAMLERSGFRKPAQILRTGLIAGWHARRSG